MTSELLTYIEKAKKLGYSDDKILSSLMQAGWAENDIKQALSNQEIVVPIPNPSKPSVISNQNNGRHSMWVAFEHILLFISLYIMSTSIALVLHFFVDKYMPGVNPNSSFLSNSDNQLQLILLRAYLAALIVSTPVFCFFFLRVTQHTMKNPDIRNLRGRKILIYLTLIVTFIIIMTNVTSLVFGLLSGNVTLNFLLHFAVTCSINGIIFIYYLIAVKDDRKLT